MAKVVIQLLEPEMFGHNQIVQQEYQPRKTHATLLIVRNTCKQLETIREPLVNNEMGLNEPSESGCGGPA